ncbi:MAG TPA: phBC6A51 family helix-turn-helix protein [Patescibacteria group bacterium]|nr:phBC6A51 family helix-turn-helix protein [Patescibacteria group bacterium]
MKENKTIEARQEKYKKLVIEQLKKIPIIEVACQKVSISRASFYRWKLDDKEFTAAVEEAITEGTALVSDLAESQLLNAIKNGNLTGIIFWLKNRNRHYGDKVELSGRVEHLQKRELTPEEKELIEKSLRLAMPKRDTVLQLPEKSNKEIIIEEQKYEHTDEIARS